MLSPVARRGFLLLTQHGGGALADREMIGEDLSAFSPLVAAASLEQASYPDPRDDFAGSDRKRKPSPTRLHVICITNSPPRWRSAEQIKMHGLQPQAEAAAVGTASEETLQALGTHPAEVVGWIPEGG